MQSDDPNQYEDVHASPGADLSWGFRVQPLDLTDCTAVFSVTTIGELDMDITADTTPPLPASDVMLAVDAATTAGWAIGLYDYRVLITFAGGEIIEYGHGKLVVS